MEARKIRGVFERVPESGDWWVRYADAGGRIRYEKVGPKSAAIQLYQTRKTEVRQRKKLPENFRERPVSFDELAQETLSYSARQHRAKTQKVMTWMVAVLQKQFGTRAAAAITAREIEDFIATRGKSKATSNRWRSLLSLIYHRAMDRERVQENPVRKVKRHRESSGRTRFLSVDEETVLRTVIRQNHPQREGEFDLALHTGMRAGEQFSLPWRDVSLDLGLITIPLSKSGSIRYIHLNAIAREALRTLARIHKADITNPDAKNLACPMPGSRRRDWFIQCCQTAGLPDFRWHDLRHTFASRLVMANVPLRTVQELLGHKSIAMTLRYAHLAPGHMQEAVDKLVPAPKPTETTTEIKPEVGLAKEAAYVN